MPRADLIPTAIQMSPAEPVPGDVVTFNSGVENAGDADSSNFNVRWLVDGQDVGAYGGHQGVAAGTTVLNGNSQFVWTATAGEHTIEFLVDVDHHILETEEGNNSVSISVGASDLVCARGTGQLSGCVQGPVTGTVQVYESVGSQLVLVDTTTADATGRFCAVLDRRRRYVLRKEDVAPNPGACGSDDARSCDFWVVNPSNYTGSNACSASSCEELGDVDFYCGS